MQSSDVLSSVVGTQTPLEQAESIATIAAIVVGGAWAYFNFFKRRTFKPSLEIDVCARWLRMEELPAVVVDLRVASRSLAKARLKDEANTLEVAVPEAAEPVPGHPPAWTTVSTFHVLTRHTWIEPSSAVSDSVLTMLPKFTEIARLTVRVVALRRWPFDNSSMERTIFVAAALAEHDARDSEEDPTNGP